MYTVRSKWKAPLVKKVEIFIAKPEKVQEDEWICLYRIVGVGEDMNFQVHGIDSVQALRCVFMWLLIALSLARIYHCFGMEKKELGFL
ncbi:DUF6968 family protein [Neisseria wadsworthii]|uniref:DUF6968 family protein n=1 Tax=Neisseria wadsworthii TaxID=607711 RepID=UPI0039892894